jgi:hypothetical protein
MEDAIRLLLRLTSPGDSRGFDRTLRPPSPQLPRPQPLVATQPAIVGSTQSKATADKIFCATSTCYYATGTRKAGCSTCIEKKCSNCCKASIASAIETGLGRLACKVHGNPEILPDGVQDRSIPMSSQSGPRVPTVPSANTQPMAPLSHSQSPALVTRSRPQAIEPRSLAQPCVGTWAGQRFISTSQPHTTKDPKVRVNDMEEQLKRTCILVVYHTVCILPLSYKIQN